MTFSLCDEKNGFRAETTRLSTRLADTSRHGSSSGCGSALFFGPLLPIGFDFIIIAPKKLLITMIMFGFG